MKIDDCINYLLTGAQHRSSLAMKKALDPYGLTPVQYSVLCCLWQKDMHNPKEIADFLKIENSTISGILERMEKKDLLVRSIDTNDRRFIRIDLTDASKNLEKPVIKAVEDVNKDILKSFTAAEQKQLKNILRAIASE